MNVEQLMSKHPHTCCPEDTMEQAARIFWERDCGCAPVVDADSHVLGMITDRDVCMAAYTQGRALRDMRVSSAMSKGAHICKTTDTVSAAEALMRTNRIRRLPVVDEHRRLVGVLSLNDIAQEAMRERSQKQKVVTQTEVAETLSTVCSPREKRLAAVVM